MASYLSGENENALKEGAQFEEYFPQLRIRRILTNNILAGIGLLPK